MNTIRSLLPLSLLPALLIGCASDLERGEALYRQGDLPGALSVWEHIAAPDEDYEESRSRADVVSAELTQMLKRYEKRALFFESEGRLGEAVLYFRLALKMDPNRRPTLEHVQELARRLRKQEDAERAGLAQALEEQGALHRANRHAANLGRLNPFDPAIQIEIHQVRLAAGGEVVQHLEAGRQAYTAGDRVGARSSFDRVLSLDPENQTALGYLSYIQRFEETEARRRIVAAQRAVPQEPLPPPVVVSQEEILAEGHYRSAQEAHSAGAPFRALAEYREAIRVSPQHAEAQVGIRKLRKQMTPMVEEVYASGNRYFQDEDLHNALRAWRRVLLIDPGHQRSIENAERAERILSRLEEIQTGGS